MNEETLNTWITQYETNATLPNKKIPCTATGCLVETTAFGSNLAGKVAKVGSIRSLLTEFKCRSCKKTLKSSNGSSHNMSESLKDGIKSLRKQRTADLVKAATVDSSETEVSTEDLMNVFAEV